MCIFVESRLPSRGSDKPGFSKALIMILGFRSISFQALERALVIMTLNCPIEIRGATPVARKTSNKVSRGCLEQNQFFENTWYWRSVSARMSLKTFCFKLKPQFRSTGWPNFVALTSNSFCFRFWSWMMALYSLYLWPASYLTPSLLPRFYPNIDVLMWMLTLHVLWDCWLSKLC